MESVAHPGGIAAWLSLDGAALLLFCCFALAKLLTLWRPLCTWPARSTGTRDGGAQPQLRLEQDQHASAVGHEAVQPTVCPQPPLPPGALATVQFVQQQHKRCQQYSSKLLTFKVNIKIYGDLEPGLLPPTALEQIRELLYQGDPALVVTSAGVRSGCILISLDVVLAGVVPPAPKAGGNGKGGAAEERPEGPTVEHYEQQVLLAVEVAILQFLQNVELADNLEAEDFVHVQVGRFASCSSWNPAQRCFSSSSFPVPLGEPWLALRHVEPSLCLLPQAPASRPPSLDLADHVAHSGQGRAAPSPTPATSGSVPLRVRLDLHTSAAFLGRVKLVGWPAEGDGSVAATEPSWPPSCPELLPDIKSLEAIEPDRSGGACSSGSSAPGGLQLVRVLARLHERYLPVEVEELEGHVEGMQGDEGQQEGVGRRMLWPVTVSIPEVLTSSPGALRLELWASGGSSGSSHLAPLAHSTVLLLPHCLSDQHAELAAMQAGAMQAQHHEVGTCRAAFLQDLAELSQLLPLLQQAKARASLSRSTCILTASAASEEAPSPLHVHSLTLAACCDDLGTALIHTSLAWGLPLAGQWLLVTLLRPPCAMPAALLAFGRQQRSMALTDAEEGRRAGSSRSRRSSSVAQDAIHARLARANWQYPSLLHSAASSGDPATFCAVVAWGKRLIGGADALSWDLGQTDASGLTALHCLALQPSAKQCLAQLRHYDADSAAAVAAAWPTQPVPAHARAPSLDLSAAQVAAVVSQMQAAQGAGLAQPLGPQAKGALEGSSAPGPKHANNAGLPLLEQQQPVRKERAQQEPVQQQVHGQELQEQVKRQAPAHAKGSRGPWACLLFGFPDPAVEAGYTAWVSAQVGQLATAWCAAVASFICACIYRSGLMPCLALWGLAYAVCGVLQHMDPRRREAWFICASLMRSAAVLLPALGITALPRSFQAVYANGVDVVVEPLYGFFEQLRMKWLLPQRLWVGFSFYLLKSACGVHMPALRTLIVHGLLPLIVGSFLELRHRRVYLAPKRDAAESGPQRSPLQGAAPRGPCREESNGGSRSGKASGQGWDCGSDLMGKDKGFAAGSLVQGLPAAGETKLKSS